MREPLNKEKVSGDRILSERGGFYSRTKGPKKEREWVRCCDQKLQVTAIKASFCFLSLR